MGDELRDERGHRRRPTPSSGTPSTGRSETQGDEAGAAERLEELARTTSTTASPRCACATGCSTSRAALRPHRCRGARRRPPTPSRRPGPRAGARSCWAPLVDLPPEERTADRAGRRAAGRRARLPPPRGHCRSGGPTSRRVGAPVDDWEHDGEMIVLDRRPQVVDAVGAAREASTGARYRRAGRPARLVQAHRRRPRGCSPSTTSRCRRTVSRPVGSERGLARDGHLRCASSRPETSTSSTLTESLPGRTRGPGPVHDRFPAALAVDSGPQGTSMAKAILRPRHHPAGRRRRRCAARRRSTCSSGCRPGSAPAVPLPAAGDDVAAAILAAVRDLDRSYLAVQGPPGTGKSTTGAEVIAATGRPTAGRSAWSRRATAPSRACSTRSSSRVSTRRWCVKKDSDAADAPRHAGSTTPSSSGGHGRPRGRRLPDRWHHVGLRQRPAGCPRDRSTCWWSTRPASSRWPTPSPCRGRRRGSCSSATRSSCRRSARPPTPTRSTRPRSAGSAHGHDTLPPELGLLPRAPPIACTPSSPPSCLAAVVRRPARRRRRAPRARTLDGVEPGLQTVLVDAPGQPRRVQRGGRRGRPHRHRHDRPHVDRPVDRTAAGHAPARPGRRPGRRALQRPGQPLRERSTRPGWPRCAVGTVDKFQGQEAAVVIVSMAASAADSSSRGAGFLLSRHRLNVAISRAQHTAFLVHSPQLTDFVPATPRGLERLGAFLGCLAVRPRRGLTVAVSADEIAALDAMEPNGAWDVDGVTLTVSQPRQGPVRGRPRY